MIASFDALQGAYSLGNSAALTEKEVIKMLEKAHDAGKKIDEVENDIKEDAQRLPSHNK